MIQRSTILLLALMCALGLTDGSRVLAQKSVPASWFVARVVDVEPFTIEYLDTAYLRNIYRHSDGTLELTVTPQAKNEDVSPFRVGDLIKGELCYEIWHNCPEPAVEKPWSSEIDTVESKPIPAPVAVNLRKLDGRSALKYANAGRLLFYRRPNALIDSMTIYRDGTVSLGSYPNGIVRKLTRVELRELQRAFFRENISEVHDAAPDYHSPSLTTIFDRVRYARLGEPDHRSDPFIARLDKMIDRYVRGAEYRITYRWRSGIKEWKYGNIFPLDKAADSKSDFRGSNWERLSKTPAPRALFVEARNRDNELNRYFYRFNGKLYWFEMGLCLNGMTATWACTNVAEAGNRDELGRTISPFTEWPRGLKVSLGRIPINGLLTNDKLIAEGIAIPRADLEKHREFYTTLLGGGWDFRDGENVYRDVMVWFR